MACRNPLEYLAAKGEAMIDFIAGLAAIAVIVSLAWGTLVWLINRPDRGNAENGSGNGIAQISVDSYRV